MKLACIALAVLGPFVSADAVAAGSPRDPVVIERLIVFGEPWDGAFVVTQGAGDMGCSAGTLTGTGGHPDAIGFASIVMTCVIGGSGTFTIEHMPFAQRSGPGDLNGPWTVVAATGDSSGLHGQGLLSYYRDRQVLTDVLVGLIGYDQR